MSSSIYYEIIKAFPPCTYDHISKETGIEINIVEKIMAFGHLYIGNIELIKQISLNSQRYISLKKEKLKEKGIQFEIDEFPIKIESESETLIFETICIFDEESYDYTRIAGTDIKKLYSCYYDYVQKFESKLEVSSIPQNDFDYLCQPHIKFPCWYDETFENKITELIL